MKKFRFRLDRVLDIFTKRLEQQKVMVHQAQVKRDDKQTQINSFKTHINNQEGRFSYLMQTARISPRECVSWENYIDFEYVTLEKHKGELVKLEKILDLEKKKYIAIDKECKTLEKLKEGKKTEYYSEQNLIERKEMDEIAIQRTIKNAKTERGY